MTERIHIGHDDKATIRCPQCLRSKTIDVSSYKTIERTVRIKCRCTCGFTFSGVLEKRGAYRKATNLAGSYRAIQSRVDAAGLITVKNISRTGLKLSMTANPGLALGDTIRVSFNLDDAARSQIQKIVVIRKIDGLELGTEFAEPLHNSNPGDRALGFYLFG
jgi:hypothetical protein